ncbi:hypothetical protein FACS1894158_07340 [Betaproteobacteria bacterium]|nr:hypothetical protein FACS1894158_07340 [Betaproteobacteria bacterium]
MKRETIEAIETLLRKEKGQSLALVEAVLAYKRCSWQKREQCLHELAERLFAGEPKNLAEVFANGPARLFAVAHGKAVAARVGRMAARLHLYIHSPSSYRRSFRTADPRPYLEKLSRILTDLLFFDWKSFDLARDLSVPKKSGEDDDETREKFPGGFYGDLIALSIDEGEGEQKAAVIAAIKDIILGDNNTQLLSDGIINGILKSENAELHKLLGDLLLAAKLQEGLRQSILENADSGRVEAFILLIKLVLEQDLIRYSSIVRALDVWMGLVEEFDDKRVVAKLLTLGHACLTDKKVLQAGLKSKDVLEIYTALWALSVREMNDVIQPVEKLLAGEKYQRLVGLYFLRQLENKEAQFAVSAKIVKAFKPSKTDKDGDLDLLCFTLLNYPFNRTPYWKEVEEFAQNAKGEPLLADENIREEQFAALLRLLPLIPAKGYHVTGKPFPWCGASIEPRDICTRLLNIAAYDFAPDKISRLIDAMPLSDSDSRDNLIRYFLQAPEPGKERDFVFAALNDKSMAVRGRALEEVLAFSTGKKPKGYKGVAVVLAPLTAEEEKLILNLLSLKTGDIRQNCVRILLALPENRPLEAVKTLLADKNENKRLGGLDLLAQLINGGASANKISKAEAAALIALISKPSDKEQVLIRAITTEAPKYGKANGFGLYDPDYRPEFPPLAANLHTLDSIFGLSWERVSGLFSSLCALIKEHRDFSYKIENYDGEQDVLLGNLVYPRCRAEFEDTNYRDVPAFEQFVLQDVWRGWIKEQKLSFSELFYFMFAEAVKRYDETYEPDYRDWVKALLKQHVHSKEVDKFCRWQDKQEYGKLALNLLNILWTEFSEAERFAVLSGALSDWLRLAPEEDWKKPVEEDEDGSSPKPDTLVDTREVGFFMSQLEQAINDDAFFKQYLALGFEVGRRCACFYWHLGPASLARGVNLGVLRKDALMRPMFLMKRNISAYAGKGGWENAKKEVEEYPLLKICADEAAARILEIELDRGDSPTEVSERALEIEQHEGAANFVKILTALGDETFVRGYIWNNGDPTKKMTLSSLLRASRPGAEESVESLRAALCGKNISEKRLIEAAMYAPAWLGLVSEHLGWPGLKSAAWYFHAHTNETLSAEKETEVARYSPITPEDFKDGAFDVAWFHEAWQTLGEERFNLLYDCAKYLTEGANHRRAQLFADAVLGRLEQKTLAKEIHDKRNKDKLLAYSLIPLIPLKGGADEAMAEALKRYEFIQQFLKESKTFGAQRRESEGKACAIAQDNLARNAGFTDALRFAWRMETLKIEEVKTYFAPKACGDYQVRVVIADNGAASLTCAKGDKALAALPAALKKDDYVLACKEVVKSLKDQFRRARASLEAAMVNRDVFSHGEITGLMEHPVVAPLLQKLLFVSVDKDGQPQHSGAFRELKEKVKGLKKDTPLRIAHPHDLFTLGVWLDCQRYAFEHKLIQPFKQIFRELYLINADEKEEKTASRRYAGHQVQPKKTVALLKGRGWTVDYEEGLQRVYYRENFYATVYAAADWFSPADTEAPTLEIVQFFSRRRTSGSDAESGKALDLNRIPPVIFSEVMRDLDLVVSVAHVGGVDPEASHSTIEMRAAIVRELLALLHVGNVTVEDRHARIKGSLGEYTVHLGSAQAHKMGRGAVNILAVPSQHRGRVFLPFADEDPRTAEVMSKILMLADDKSIKDPAILGQIG